MKIAYDISILGQGYINPKARTGIFRVVESLFLELHKQGNVEINAIALNQKGSVWDDQSTKLYLENICPTLRSTFQSQYSSRLRFDYLYYQAVKLQRQLIQFSVDKNILIYKLARSLEISVNLIAQRDIELNFPWKNYDIYHSSYFPLPPQDITGSLIRVLTVYDLIPIYFRDLLTPRVYRRFMKTIESLDKKKDFVICISENTKKDFCDYTGMSPERVFVTPLAAADHFSSIKNSEKITPILKRYHIPTTSYLLSLCTLEPRKNLSLLIRCFSKLITEYPNLDFNLVLVGVSGWKNADIFQAAKENPTLQSRIIFTGYVPDEDLSAIYSGATAFVYPSLYEGFGLPPLEAMQCGTPVITSNTSSLPEVVGDAGIMIDPKQEDELCQALLNIIQDSELRANLSQKGIERASQFSWTRCAEETVKVYRIAANQ